MCDLVVKVRFLSTFSNPFLSILRKWLVKGCNIILRRRMLHFFVLSTFQEKLLQEYLSYKSSWFGSKPRLSNWLLDCTICIYWFRVLYWTTLMQWISSFTKAFYFIVTSSVRLFFLSCIRFNVLTDMAHKKWNILQIQTKR